jgi:diguanylate cyclase (GGDEF)-like protein
LPCELTLVSLLDDPSVGAVVIAAHDITRLVAARRALERLAASDPLTGVANRHHLEERLRHLLDRERSGPEQAVAMVFVDLDGFKQVNDTAGHLAGDGLLRQVARALISAVRAGDVVARVGGDEFVVLGTLERPEDAALLAERVAAAICRPHEVAGRVLNVTASIGVALARPGDPAEDLWAEADRRMYEAKAEKSGS